MKRYWFKRKTYGWGVSCDMGRMVDIISLDFCLHFIYNKGKKLRKEVLKLNL